MLRTRVFKHFGTELESDLMNFISSKPNNMEHKTTQKRSSNIVRKFLSFFDVQNEINSIGESKPETFFFFFF